MEDDINIPGLHAMKQDGRKIVAVVVWDYQLAKVVDQAGVEIISVGDTVGTNLWGHRTPLEVTMDEMVIVCRAVRRGVTRALLSCDLPFGPIQEGTASAVRAAVRLVKEAGADMVKLDGAADYPDAVSAITRAGIPVFAQLGLTPQTALRHGVAYSTTTGPPDVPEPIRQQVLLETDALVGAGAVLLDVTNSGPVLGPEVVSRVAIPVLGGMGGGPWLDGRIRMAHAAIGYSAAALTDGADRYANVARIAHDAIQAYASDVRAGRQIRGGTPR